MKNIKVDLPRELDQIRIIIMSDWHIGSKECNYNLIKEQVRQVLENENTYCVINGDIINNDTKASVGDIYGQTMSPMEQMKKAIDLLKPIKNKILALNRGNHCDRTYRQDGIDLMCFLARELEIESRYDPVATLLFIRFGELSSNRAETNGSGEKRKACYSLYMTHGSSGGRTVGAKGNALQRLGDVVKADICVVSHTHFPMCFRECYYEIDYRNSCAVKKETVYVNSGSTLEYESTYAEKMSLRPSSLYQPVIILNGKKKEVQVLA
jgi:predicted phosphodiesterase